MNQSSSQKALRDTQAERRESGLTINKARKVFTSAEGTQVRAVDDVSLAIPQGEFFILLGPSGCGKTTLLRSIAGLETLDAGEIYLGDTRIDGLAPYRRPVNTVFQSYALFPHMTIAQNIAFGLQMEKQSKATIAKTVGDMLDLVHLSEIGGRKPNQLSGGQQQRVALARALAKSPQVLLLDESLSALDFKLRRQMQVELKRIQRETGITFVFVTHDRSHRYVAAVSSMRYSCWAEMFSRARLTQCLRSSSERSMPEMKYPSTPGLRSSSRTRSVSLAVFLPDSKYDCKKLRSSSPKSAIAVISLPVSTLFPEASMVFSL